METPSNLKIELRKKLLLKRKEIPVARREEAAISAFEALCQKGTLLSFSTFGSEIDLSKLNAHLSLKNRVFIAPYKIEALTQVPLEKIDFILVPALAFDKNHYRIGYGKGYYDRFLANTQIPTIGVGFKEQLLETLLPIDPWDVPVQELLLF